MKTYVVTMPAKWQWVSDAYGEMGWFSPAERAYHSGFRHDDGSFINGHWKPIFQDEVNSFNRYVQQLAYEQS